MKQRNNRKTVRFDDDELTDAVRKMRSWGYGEISAFLRFAVKQLPEKNVRA